MHARPFPSHPDLAQFRKQAKELLKACDPKNPDGISAWAKRWFQSTADEPVKSEARLRGATVTPTLSEAIQKEAIEHIEKRILASKLSKPNPTLADAQFFIAREHGYESWPKFIRQIQALQQNTAPETKFELAADAIVSGNIRTLRQLLREDPALVHMRSQRTHQAPLLHYVAANGIEDFRQRTPPNIVAITGLLLDGGAEIDATSNDYGGGCTALGLAATSVHPERAGVQEALLQLLLDRGAIIDRPGLAGNRHTAVEACLANGRAKAAAFLAARGAQLSLETAAGAGAFDAVKSFFQNGVLKPPATGSQLQRGFVWACMYGHCQIAEFLLDRGVLLQDASGTGATGLHWAAGGAYLDIVRLLVARGAPLEELNQWGGTVLQHAGWGFANNHDVEADYFPIFEELLRAGAHIQDGWLRWLHQQTRRSETIKARLEALFRHYGALT